MKKKTQKTIFIISCLAILAGLFSFSNAPVAKAITIEELKAQISAIQKQIAELQQQLIQTQTKEVWCYDFKTNLGYGSKGEEIQFLQNALTKEGFYQGNINGIFDRATLQAVISFQEKYQKDILAPFGLQQGTGLVGSSTKTKLNNLYGCGSIVAAKSDYLLKYNKENKKANMHLDVNLPEYKLNIEDKWTVLECDNENMSYFQEKGEPGLFSLNYLISIPSAAEVDGITVNPTTKNIKLEKPIIPIPEAVPINEAPKPPIPNEEIYNSSEPYPQKDFDYSIAKQGNTFLLVLKLYPFKYIGKSQTVIVSEYLSVDISLKNGVWKPNPVPRSAIDKNLKEKLLNPESAFFK